MQFNFSVDPEEDFQEHHRRRLIPRNLTKAETIYSLGDALLAILEGLISKISFASDPTMVGSPMSLNLSLIPPPPPRLNFCGPRVSESTKHNAP